MLHGRIRRVAAGLAALTALALGGAAIAGATGDGEEPEASLTGPAAVKASAAALEATGGGTVKAVERDSEMGATYEVEVQKKDGSTVDVRLDDSYAVIGVDGDRESADDGAGDTEDAAK